MDQGKTDPGTTEPVEDARMDFSRPSALRLWGFLSLTAGGLLLGLGSFANWTVVGFTGDKQHVLDLPTKGTDVWEGKVTLVVGLLALVGMIAIRLASSDRIKKGLAYLILVSGALAAGIGIFDFLRFTARFSSGNDVLAALADKVAAVQGVPAEQILQRLLDTQSRLISVSHGPGLWLTVAGGVLVAAGGLLSLMWVNNRAAAVQSKNL